jgi:hypothetical protein
MTTPQRSASSGTSLSPNTRHATAALIAVVVIAVVLALTIVVASVGGGSGEDDGPIHVVPSAPLPPSPAERDQPPGQWGPGMRP